MVSLFLAPHNDDESLFGAYIIQAHKPLVVILTDSYIQYERGEKQCSAADRRDESIAAMKVLDAVIEFCHIPDKDFNESLCAEALQKFGQPDLVFAPLPNEGGNWMHDVTGQVADKLWPGHVQHYSTYTKDREYPAGSTPFPATDEMKRKKLAAIQCYKSQMTNICRMYLTTPHKEEYLWT